MHDRAQDTQLILKLSRPGDLMDSAPQEALESSREEGGGWSAVDRMSSDGLDVSHLALGRPFWT